MNRSTVRHYSLRLDSDVTIPVRGTLLVGSAPSCPVRLTGADVAPRHARFSVGTDCVVVEALDPHAQVFVDEVRVHDSQVLVGGERVRIGDTHLTVTMVDTSERRESATATETPVARRSSRPKFDPN